MSEKFDGQSRGEEEVAETDSQMWERRLDEAREMSSEKQNETAEIGQAKFGVTLRTLMRRSGDNPELLNALEKFLGSLDNRSWRGESDGPLMSPEKLINFLNDSAKELPRT